MKDLQLINYPGMFWVEIVNGLGFMEGLSIRLPHLGCVIFRKPGLGRFKYLVSLSMN